MVAIGFLAIALGVIVRRSEGFMPMTESAAMVPQAPPAPIQFHPVDARPSAARRRVRRNPLDAAARDALSAFDDDPNGDAEAEQPVDDSTTRGPASVWKSGLSGFLSSNSYPATRATRVPPKSSSELVRRCGVGSARSPKEY